MTLVQLDVEMEALLAAPAEIARGRISWDPRVSLGRPCGRYWKGSSPDLCVKAEEAPRLRLGCLGDLLFLEE